MKSFFGSKYFPWVTFFLLITLTLVVWQIFLLDAKTNLEKKFESQTEEINERIVDRMKTYEQILYSVQGLFAASTNVERSEWNKFIESQNIFEKYDGIQAIGFSKLVGGIDDVKLLENEIQKEGFENFKVHPLGNKETYHPVVFIYPLDERNKNAFGLDMSFEQNRKESMEESAESGDLSITRKIILVQENQIDTQNGFLMILPIYKNGEPVENAEQRKNALVGYVHGAFRINDLMDGINVKNSNLHFSIYNDNINEENKLFDLSWIDNRQESLLPELSRDYKIQSGNKEWIVHYTAYSSFNNIYSNMIQIGIIVVGSTLSMFWFYVMRIFQNNTKKLTLLTKITKKINLDEDTHIPNLLTNNDDDIGKLAKAFEEMHLRIQLKNSQINENLIQIKNSTKMLNQLKESLDKYSIVAITDLNGKITYVNKKFCEISKYSEEELIGQDHRLLKSGYHPQEFYQGIWKTITAGKIWQGDIKNKAKDGSFYWVNSIIAPVFNDAGKIDNYIAIRTDVTKQKEGELKLRDAFKQLKENSKSLEDMKRALDASSIVAITDPQGIITYVNKKFCEISKYSEEELIGQNHRLLKSGYHPQEFYQGIWNTICKGNVWHGDIKNKAKDGSFYWVRTIIVPFVGVDGKPTQYIAIRTDITQQKHNEELIKSQVAQMEEINKNKEEFTAMISHELKTPITPIILWSDALKEPGMLGELNYEQLDAVNKIGSCADQLQGLVSDMFDVYKLDLNKMTFSKNDVSINEIIDEVITNSQKLATPKGVTIQNSSKEVLTTFSDKRRLIQVLRNLINNSIDFVPEGTGNIEVNAKSKDNNILFCIKDNGIGISKEDQAKLFKKFYQTDTSFTREHGGSGLGLTICKGIVEGLGGKIWVESEKGKGASFLFTIPKVVVPEQVVKN